MSDAVMEVFDLGFDLLVALLGVVWLLKGISMMNQCIASFQSICGG